MHCIYKSQSHVFILNWQVCLVPGFSRKSTLKEHYSTTRNWESEEDPQVTAGASESTQPPLSFFYDDKASNVDSINNTRFALGPQLFRRSPNQSKAYHQQYSLLYIWYLYPSENQLKKLNNFSPLHPSNQLSLQQQIQELENSVGSGSASIKNIYSNNSSSMAMNNNGGLNQNVNAYQNNTGSSQKKHSKKKSKISKKNANNSRQKEINQNLNKIFVGGGGMHNGNEFSNSNTVNNSDLNNYDSNYYPPPPKDVQNEDYQQNFIEQVNSSTYSSSSDEGNNHHFSNDELGIEDYGREKQIRDQLQALTLQESQGLQYLKNSKEEGDNGSFENTQELNLQAVMRNQQRQSENHRQAFQQLQINGQIYDDPISIQDLKGNKRQAVAGKSNSSSFDLNMLSKLPPQHSLINLTQVTGNQNQNPNQSSSLLLNSSLISHTQSHLNANQINLTQLNQQHQYSQAQHQFSLQNSSYNNKIYPPLQLNNNHTSSHQNYLQNSQQIQGSQAIAGAMKALQQKLKSLEDHNEGLLQQNQDLKTQLKISLEKAQREKEKFGEIMLKQKLSHQHLEKESKVRIDEDLKQVQELRQRVEQSSKAIDKMMKENLGLKKQNQALQVQLQQQEQDGQQKLIQSMQEMRDSEKNLKKKCKKLSKEKKELALHLKMLSEENMKQKQYFSSLITELEQKLKELISTNHNLNTEYETYKEEQDRVMDHANNQLQQLKSMLNQGQFQVESKESENQQLKIQLQDFQIEIKAIKKQLQAMQIVQHNNEIVREKADEFVQQVVNVNDMLVKSIEQRKCEKIQRKASQNNSFLLGHQQQLQIPDHLTPITLSSNLPSHRGVTEAQQHLMNNKLFMQYQQNQLSHQQRSTPNLEPFRDQSSIQHNIQNLSVPSSSNQQLFTQFLTQVNSNHHQSSLSQPFPTTNSTSTYNNHKHIKSLQPIAIPQTITTDRSNSQNTIMNTLTHNQNNQYYCVGENNYNPPTITDQNILPTESDYLPIGHKQFDAEHQLYGSQDSNDNFQRQGLYQQVRQKKRKSVQHEFSQAQYNDRSVSPSQSFNQQKQHQQQQHQQSKQFAIEDEMKDFQFKYDALIRDIEASKMPGQYNH
eukprot:403365189